MKTSRVLFPVLALPALAACAPADVTVEVLPPRTSVTCGAPSLSDPASSRGLLDVRATDSLHGAFLADLRLGVKGADARIDGVSVKYEVKGANLEDFNGAIVGGDAVLVGEDDELRQVILENAELLSREAAIELLEDGDLDLSAQDYATVTITLTPVLADEDAGNVTPAASTFALDVCDGCLVTPPSLEECPAGPSVNLVCRPGQDRPLFYCGGAS